MTEYFTNNFSIINLHKNPSTKSEIVTQMIYGESFSILKKSKKWLKVKIKDYNYKGYLKNRNFSSYFKPTHKIKSLKANVYKILIKKGLLRDYLSAQGYVQNYQEKFIFV